MPIIKKKDDLNYEYCHGLYAEQIFDDYLPTKLSSRMYEEVRVSIDKSTFKLIDKNQRDTVSLIHGKTKIYHGIEYFEINWTYSKLQKRGLLTYLIELLIKDFGYKILSDKYHTCRAQWPSSPQT